jgi:uncharacterized protein (DUF983 family)
MPDSTPTRWTRKPAPRTAAWPDPPLLTAMQRGLIGRCPACGGSHLFSGWLRVARLCPACTAPLGEIRADDAPPYFTIFLVGHLVVGTQLMLERSYELPLWAEAAIFLPATLLLSLLLLRPIKGATVGLMLKLGFGLPDHDAG